MRDTTLEHRQNMSMTYKLHFTVIRASLSYSTWLETTKIRLRYSKRLEH